MKRPSWTKRTPKTISDLVEPPDGSAFIRRSSMKRVISFLFRDDVGAQDDGYPPGCHWFEFGDLSDDVPTTWLLLCKDVHEDDDTLEPLLRTTPQEVTLSF